MTKAEERVLVVDDSEDMRELYQLTLEEAGYEVATAASGQEGLAKTREWHPDLLLLDVVMPEMTGLEVLMHLRSDFAPPLPQVILSTAFDITEEEALRRGALMLLRKPISPEYLLEFVSRALHGEQVPAHVAAAARGQATEARRRARAAAAALLREVDARTRPSGRAISDWDEYLRFFSRYLGLGTLAAAVLRDDSLIVGASAGEAPIASGTNLGALLPETERVLETGTSLVVADPAVQRCSTSGAGALDGVRFFAGVPLLARGNIAIGVLCLFSSQPHNLAAEDLFLLQILGRRGSLLLQMMERGAPDSQLPGRHGPYIAVRETFEMMLAAEMRSLERKGGSIAVVVADIGELDAVHVALARADSPERLAAGVLAPGRVAFYKRDTGAHATEQLGVVLSELPGAELTAMGAVSVSGRILPAIGGQDFLRLAELTLARALELGEVPQRLVLDMKVSPFMRPARPEPGDSVAEESWRRGGAQAAVSHDAFD